MDYRPVGRTGLRVSPIGFGAFKIGRNEGVKYPRGYALPDDEQVGRLLHGVLELGINLIDTAPAYGLSQQRIGRHLASRREEFVLATKVGERFVDGQSCYDFSREAVVASLEQSLRDLRTDVLDLVFIHSDGRDMDILERSDVVEVLLDFKQRGLIRGVGLSGKTPEGAAAALAWADAIEVTYHQDDQTHAAVMRQAADAERGVLVKKGLASGHLPAAEAIGFVLGHAAVQSVLIGSLNLDHLKANVLAAEAAGRVDPPGS